MSKGIFITIEGPEGSGKSTAINKISSYLMDEGYEVVMTREPGGIDIAEQIRSVILNNSNTKMDARCEALLYAAARRQHLIEKIIPALNDNKIILCDRFIDSSLAYQGVARNLGINEVMEINNFAIDGLLPDKTLFFDIPVEVGLMRIQSNNRETNRLDKEGLDFHEKVYSGYMEICKNNKERIEIIDASQSVDEVVSDCINVIRGLL